MASNGLSRRRFIQGVGATGIAALLLNGDQKHEGFARLPDSVKRQRFSNNPLSRGASTTWAISKDSSHTPYLVVNSRMCPPNSTQAIRVTGTISVFDKKTQELVETKEVQALAGDDYRVRATFNLDPNRHYEVHAQANELSDGKFIAQTNSPLVRPSNPNILGREGFVRIHVASCMQYSTGYWNAYSFSARRKPDAFFLIGDSIYADQEQTMFTGDRPREEKVPKATNRDLFLAKYLVCWDDDLKELLKNVPVIGVPDDHEMQNNIEGTDESKSEAVEDGCAAYAMAYASPDNAEFEGFYRRIDFGQGTRVILLDTRRFRDSSKGTMLGATQLAWLDAELRAAKSDNVSRCILISTVSFTSGLDRIEDSWNGFSRERQHIVDEIARLDLPVTFVSGDLHTFYAGAVHLDPTNIETDIVAYEFEGGAVSSRVGRTGPVNDRVLAHTKESHGFMELDIYPDGTVMNTWFLYDATKRDYVPEAGARFLSNPPSRYGNPTLSLQSVNPRLIGNPGEIPILR